MDDVEVLMTERAITRALYRYARGVDHRDFDEVRACYWEDGYDEHTTFSGTVPDYLAWLEAVLPAVDVSTHQFTNVLIEIDADGRRATSDASCLNVLVWGPDRNGRARHVTTGLRYVDAWERRGGEWRVLRRRCTREWSRVDEVTAYSD